MAHVISVFGPIPKEYSGDHILVLRQSFFLDNYERANLEVEVLTPQDVAKHTPQRGNPREGIELVLVGINHRMASILHNIAYDSHQMYRGFVGPEVMENAVKREMEYHDLLTRTS